MQVSNNQKHIASHFSKSDYFLMTAVVLSTANPFFVSNKYVQLIVFLITTFYLWRKKKKLFLDNKIFSFFIIFSILVSIQGIIWNFSLFSLFSSFILTFIYSYFLFRIYSFHIVFLLEKTIYGLTIISIILYFSHTFIPVFGNVLSQVIQFISPFSADVERHSRSLIVYTYRPEITTVFNINRNSGFTHEPGAFALFLNLAISINYLRTKKLISKRNLFYIFGIITTFSTAGFFSLFVLFSLLLVGSKKKAFYLIIYLAIAIASVYFIFDSEIMYEKVSTQYNEQMGTNLEEQNSGRFSGFRKSITVLSKYPLYGRGILSISMPISSFDPEYANYGWLSYIAKLGLIFGSLFLYLYIKGLKVLFSTFVDRLSTFILILSLFINLSSQSYITKPYLLLFLFFGLYYNNINGKQIIDNRGNRIIW